MHKGIGMKDVTTKAVENDQQPLLLLWDIDGTLLSSDGAGRGAMARAFLELFGVPRALDGLELAGRTDEAILLEAVGQTGVQASQKQLECFRNRYYDLLQDELSSPDRSPRALPGVLHVLETLKAERRYVSGLLTGNWKTSGYIKLSAVGLAEQFTFGAFGGEASTREDLLPLALERARKVAGSAIPANRAVVIGDTPRDIAVAKAHGAKSIGVATGVHSCEELRMADSDCVLENMTHLRVLETLSLWLEEN
jgi:phosphoglycolate phosphatase-like HAD superfamily hydrolase